MADIRIKRGTRAQIDSAASSNGLAVGEPYLITDESRPAVGTADDDYSATLVESDIGVTVCSQTDSRLTNSREWTATTVAQAEAEAGTATTRRAWTAQRVFQSIGAWWNSSAAKSKLDGIATGATANSTDAQLRDRSTHTGTQAASTISDSTAAGRALLTAADAAAQRTSLGLGTAATTASTAYATAAQGAKADTALQPANMTTLVRERLTADRTYYVRPDGNDTNSGLENTVSGAFRTIHKAVDVVCGRIDTAEYQVTIQLASGNYFITSQITLYNVVGAKIPNIVGDEANPSNVVITTENAIALFYFAYGAAWRISGIRMFGPSVFGCLRLPEGGAYVGIKNIDIGQIGTTGNHIFALNGSLVEILGSYRISGGARYHWNASQGASIFCVDTGRIITIINTPHFDYGFCRAQTAIIRPFGITFSGSATGPRYVVQALGSINTNAAGETYLPGNAPGTVETGGIYV